MKLPNGKIIICTNQKPHPTLKDTFLCSANGLVTKGCCIECLTLKTESEEEKLEREIKINKKIIEYHQKEIGELRMETAKKVERLYILRFGDSSC